MTAETKDCQNCKQQFTIEPDDFQFYEKIKVPPPTWCPECRFMRRFLWRNEKVFYKNVCGLCGKNLVNNVSPDRNFSIYCNNCWWSDKWDPLSYGREYDFTKTFFEQFKDLMLSVPRLNLWGFSNVNSDYANYTGYSKNIYLSCAVKSENIFYSSMIERSKDCFDCYWTNDSELCYENLMTSKSYKSSFLINCRECTDSIFLYNCTNCQNCFLSSNLKNKSFSIKNKQYSKDDYFKELEKYEIDSYASFQKTRDEFLEIVEKSLHKFANILKSTNVTGDYITNSKNVVWSFMVEGENIKYCWRASENMKDSYDVSGSLGNELIYEGSVVADNSYMTKFYCHSKNNRDSTLCDHCSDSTNLFGCVGVKNKQYCVLNKQYTKEEYEELVSKIIKHMNDMPYVDARGRAYRYGEFFPPEISPFAYNETIAQEYFPLTKEEALARGHRWHDPDTRAYTTTKKPQDLPDHIKDVDESILEETIGCMHEGKCNEQCTTAFKIIPEELSFYRRMNLPLPRLCPSCRHYERIKQRNPMKLWHRQCMCDYGAYQNTAKHPHHPEGRCQNEFETPYAPERPEIVYCESCYNSEVV